MQEKCLLFFCLLVLFANRSNAKLTTDCPTSAQSRDHSEVCKAKIVVRNDEAGMSSQQLFFEFHQAIAYLESYKARGFLISRSKAEIHLNVLRRTGPVADPVLAKMLERILSIHTEIDAIPLQIIEKFRTDLHALALDRGWKHSPQWHWEVTQCSDK